MNARTCSSVAFLNQTSFQNFWKSASVVRLSCAMMENSVPSSFLREGQWLADGALVSRYLHITNDIRNIGNLSFAKQTMR